MPQPADPPAAGNGPCQVIVTVESNDIPGGQAPFTWTIFGPRPDLAPPAAAQDAPDDPLILPRPPEGTPPPA
jgi:hypothetical protein